jgi:hypothetical protein
LRKDINQWSPIIRGSKNKVTSLSAFWLLTKSVWWGKRMWQKAAIRAVPMRSTSSPINYLRAECLILSDACPFDRSNPSPCPFHGIRERSQEGRMAWLAELSEEAIFNIHTYCMRGSCLWLERHIWENKDTKLAKWTSTGINPMPMNESPLVKPTWREGQVRLSSPWGKEGSLRSLLDGRQPYRHELILYCLIHLQSWKILML